MAIIKIVDNYCDDVTALQNLCTYIIDYSKTQGLYGGRGLEPQNAFEDICEAQSLWRKTSGRRAYHFVVNFSDEEPISPYDAKQVASEISFLFFPNYQVLYGVHCTQSHLHIHFAVNPVSLADGHKLHMDYVFITNLRSIIEKIICCYLE